MNTQNARRTDPISSHIAGAPEYDRYVFARRLPELARDGFVFVSGMGKGKQMKWQAV